MVIENYVRNAVVLKITDGDTVDLRVDLGCDIKIDMKVRLYGINAPELSTTAGKLAKQFLAALLPLGMRITVQTIKDTKEKYGRYLGILYLEGDIQSINDKLIVNGYALPYDGGARG